MNIFNKRSLGFFALPCIGILGALSGNANADSGGLTVLKQDFDAEVAARRAGDLDEAAARESADADITANLNKAIAEQAFVNSIQNFGITELHSELEKAQAEIAELRALITKYHPKVGDRVRGGVVFYVDETGSHGLVAAVADRPNGPVNEIEWYNGKFKATGATDSFIGAGKDNTWKIITAQWNDIPGGIYAANAASDFAIQEDGVTPCTGAANEVCLTDWYLPSKYELGLLYNKKDIVGGFSNYWYWSSTESAEYSATDAWWLNFSDGGTWHQSGKQHGALVRPIRAF